MFKFSGRRPARLGVAEGRLAPCPKGRPNCVCSQMPSGALKYGSSAHIPPFSYAGLPGDAMTRLLAVLLGRPDCKVITQTPTYVHAEFSSRFFGFVDDAEFLLDDAAGVIHVRSASRLGYSDLGVNRARLEVLREAFDDID